MEILVKILLLTLTAYSVAAILVPGLRIVHWRQTPKDLGALSYLGLSLFVGSPTLLITGLIPEGYAGLMFWVAILGFLIMCIGYVIDMV